MIYRKKFDQMFLKLRYVHHNVSSFSPDHGKYGIFCFLATLRGNFRKKDLFWGDLIEPTPY